MIYTLSALALRWSVENLMASESLASALDLKHGTKIFSYLSSHEQMEAMYRVGVSWDRRLGLQQDCRQQYRVNPLSLRVISPISLPEGQSVPTTGQWVCRFGFERCGETKIYNAMFVAKDGIKPEVAASWPGVTNASPQLISDAMLTAAVKASTKLKQEQGIECKDSKDIIISDMEITQQPHDLVESGKTYAAEWQERWSFIACGQPVDILIDFVPDGKGGTYFHA